MLVTAVVLGVPSLLIFLSTCAVLLSCNMMPGVFSEAPSQTLIQALIVFPGLTKAAN